VKISGAANGPGFFAILAFPACVLKHIGRLMTRPSLFFKNPSFPNGPAAEPTETVYIAFFQIRVYPCISAVALGFRGVGEFPKWKMPCYPQESCFLTGFSFVLWPSAVDTHAAYENESSSSTPTCVSCRPSF